MGKTEEHRCNFFAVRLRALGFDGMRCVIECNHNNVPFGMLSKVHRCINKMHLILSGQTGERNSPLPSLNVIGDTKPIAGENEAVKFFQMPRFALLSLLSSPLSWKKEIPFRRMAIVKGRKKGGENLLQFSNVVEKLSTIFIYFPLHDFSANGNTKNQIPSS